MELIFFVRYAHVYCNISITEVQFNPRHVCKMNVYSDCIDPPTTNEIFYINTIELTAAGSSYVIFCNRKMHFLLAAECRTQYIAQNKIILISCRYSICLIKITQVLD